MDSNPILSKSTLSIAVAASMLLAVYAVVASIGAAPSLGAQQATAQQQSTTTDHNGHSATSDATLPNKPQKLDLDGVTLTFEAPETVHASDLSTIKMTVSDTKSGKPLTHVDWSIIVKSPSGEEIYKSSTLHSHVGTMDLSYAFSNSGQNTISVQIASLGPKMMGMDVPGMAQTRVLVSGDPMMGWQTDPNFFFGTRSTEFKVNVGSQGGMRTLDGTEPGTKINLELSTNPSTIIAGQPTTLIFNVMRADNGTFVTHPDALLSIRGSSSRPFMSADMGNPMMPVNGAFHGHTGTIAFTTTFPASGMYVLNVHLNSLPVSNYIFGQASTNYFIRVVDAEGQSENQLATEVTNPNEPNHIAILGQDPPFFSPNNLTVKAGTTITVLNHDSIPHTITSTNDGKDVQSPTASGTFDTGVLMGNADKQITIDKAGTYNYFCSIHPFMRGTITVTG